MYTITEKEEYKLEHHSFTKKIGSRISCSKCGLLRLHNQATDWAVGKGCNYSDHIAYKSIIKQFSKKY